MYNDFDDEDEEEVPDENIDTSEMMERHSRIVLRDTITSNILTHSFTQNTAFSPLGHEFSNQHMRVIGDRRIMLASHSSFNPPHRDELGIAQNLICEKRSLFSQATDVNERAVANWARLFKNCMLEYRRHRLRKAKKGMISPSPPKKHQTVKHKPRRIINARPLYKFYPCVRFIQRCIRLKKLKRSLRYAAVPT